MDETTQAGGPVNANGGAVDLPAEHEHVVELQQRDGQRSDLPIAINFTASFNGGTIASP